MHRVAVLGVWIVLSLRGMGLEAKHQAPVIPSPSQADVVHAVHDALFASFLPVEELPDDPKTTALLAKARDTLWETSERASAFRGMLAPFVNLEGFGRACGIADALNGDTHRSFAELNHWTRERVLLLLGTCDLDGPRRLVATVRNFYVVRGYGVVQEDLTGVAMNLFATPEYVASHRPQLPASHLRYVAARREIVSSDGVFDYLIVGSGPAGSVLAHELRRGGKRVLLVERGSFVVPGAMQSRLIEDLVDTRSSTDGTVRIRNGMAVGGGSQVNVDLCFAPTTAAVRTKIEGWRKEGRIGPNDFTQAELGRAYEWVQRALGTRSVSAGEINANNRALWDGATAAGLHPQLYRLNTYSPGESPYPVTDKRSAETQLLLEALEDRKNPLSMLPDADVRRILFAKHGTKQRAYGVEIQMRSPISEPGTILDPNGLRLAAGQTVTVRARTVLLSAGALGSPTILLRSGVKNDQIGHGVVLHPSIPVMGKFDRTIDALDGTQASVYVDDKLIDPGYALEAMAAEPLYAAVMSPGPALHSLAMVRSFRNLAGFGVMLVDSSVPTNRLRLNDQDEAEVDYTLSEPDKVRFLQGVSEAIRIMFLAGAKEVYLPTTEDVLGKTGTEGEQQPVVLTNPDEAKLVEANLKFVPGRTLLSSAHMQATDRMGQDPRDSVVGTDFHVWGTENLFVVDGSVFPTSIGANPMQSIYTFAKIFADHDELMH